MADRIKGQDVEILFTLDGAPQEALLDIQSIEVELQQEILSEGYLGETTNRKDSIFNGVRGRVEAHVESQDFLTFFQAIIDKARRREPGTVINLKATLNFPNGQTPRVLFPDVEFGNLPLNFGSRQDYGMISLDFEGSTFNVLT